MILTVGFLMIFCRSASADFKTGLDYYKGNDYAAAFREWLPLAKQGDPLAQLYLALMYEEGRGVRRSFGEAHRWYERAAATFPPGEHRERAIKGRNRMTFELAKGLVDPALVGNWRVNVPDPTGGAPAEWLLEISDTGDFWFTIERGAAKRSEKGQFRAKNGKWQWTTRSEEQEGTYRVFAPDSIELTGHLGTRQWARVGTPGAAVATGRVLFQDDFVWSLWQVGTRGCARTSYGLADFVFENIDPSRSCSFNFWEAGSFQDNVRIELTSSLRKRARDAGYGLKFGTLHDGSDSPYYVFVVSGNGSYSLGRWAGSWTDLIGWTRHPQIKTGYGATNQLAVEIQGRTIKAFVNGVQVGTAQAPAAVTGFVGLQLDAPGLEAVFTNLRVTELSASKVAGRMP